MLSSVYFPLFVVLSVSVCVCLTNGQLSANGNYYYYKNSVTFWSANTQCKNRGHLGLAIANTAEEREEIKQLLAGIRPRRKTWIGFRNLAGGSFQWIDGTSAARAWSAAWSEPLSKKEKRKVYCGAGDYRVGPKDVKYFVDPCTRRNEFICSTGTGSGTPTEASGTGTYKYFSSKMDWSAANRACKARGFDGLAIAATTDEQLQLKQLVSQIRPYIKAWIGFRNLAGNRFVWFGGADATPMWNQVWNEPLSNREKRLSFCGAIDYRPAPKDVKYFVDNCSRKRSFVCGRNAASAAAIADAGWLSDANAKVDGFGMSAENVLVVAVAMLSLMLVINVWLLFRRRRKFNSRNSSTRLQYESEI